MLTHYCRSQLYLETPIDEDRVLMDPETGTCFALNSVGSAIWEALQTPRTKEELIQILVTNYKVTEEECRVQVDPFLEQMTTLKLIHLVSE